MTKAELIDAIAEKLLLKKNKIQEVHDEKEKDSDAPLYRFR